MADTEVRGGEVSDGAVINAGDTQLIDSGGVANHTTINMSGDQILSPGAVTHDVVVTLGGSQDASAGGNTYDTILNGGQQFLNQFLAPDGTTVFSPEGAEHTIINSGGTQNDQGRAFDTVINAGGTHNVTGYSTNTSINDGGTQFINTAFLNSGGLHADFVAGAGDANVRASCDPWPDRGAHACTTRGRSRSAGRFGNSLRHQLITSRAGKAFSTGSMMSACSLRHAEAAGQQIHRFRTFAASEALRVGRYAAASAMPVPFAPSP